MSTNRREIRKALEQWFAGSVHALLMKSGFARPKDGSVSLDPLQVFRSRQTHIDVVGCRIFQRPGVDEIELFAEMGVFVRSVPHYSGAVFSAVEGLAIKDSVDCHFRKNLKPSWILSHALSPQTVWIAKGTGPHLDKCLSDMHSKIEGAGLPWFEKFNDLYATYNAVLDKHRGGTKLPGSWGHLNGETLVKGFLGLECGDWQTAAENIAAALAMKNPHHSLDERQPQRHYYQIEAQLEAALDQAKRHLVKQP